MAEISARCEISEGVSKEDGSDNKNDGSEVSQPSDFDPKTMRKKKPGMKRLVINVIVFFSFLLGLPFFLKSVEIYRSPLPFQDIDSLEASIESSPLYFPCQFQVVFVDLDHGGYEGVNAYELGLSIVAQMQKLTGMSPVCGTCGDNFTVSVTLDSNDKCIHNQNAKSSTSWRCGALLDYIHFSDDESFDEYLESVLGGGEGHVGNNGKIYTVVVVNKNEEVRAVVGKHRHAWIVGESTMEDLTDKVAEIFVKVFVNGGKDEGSVRAEFMPVGADGTVVLSFSLLNADPHDWIYDWDFHEIDENLLAPVIEALGPVANMSLESQVLYHTPKSSFSYWDERQGNHIFSSKDMPFFVNSNEWHLDTSVAAGGRSKVLQFVIYVPSTSECPLQLQLPNGDLSMTNGFISPMWGGIVVWNPPGCSRHSDSIHPIRHKISSQALMKTFEVLVGQLRQIFGLNSYSIFFGASGTYTLLTSHRGFTEWELDVLSRQHTCFNLLQCGTSLGSLSRLVQSLPRMIIKDEIGKQVKFSLEAAKLAQGAASVGAYDDSAVYSRQARILAEDAFFHPSIISVSYYSFEHCFAVYSPYFLPVSLHVVLAVAKEWKRYKREMAKYRTWSAKRD